MIGKLCVDIGIVLLTVMIGIMNTFGDILDASNTKIN